VRKIAWKMVRKITWKMAAKADKKVSYQLFTTDKIQKIMFNLLNAA